MNQKWHSFSVATKGLLAGIASALFLTAYLVVNKHVYNTYDIGALQYSLVFAIVGGIFGALSLIRNMNSRTFLKVRKDARIFVVLSLASFFAVGLLVIGQRYTTSVNASLISTATILTTIFFSAVMLREHITSRQKLWLVVLFVGMYLGIVGLHRLHISKGDAIILSSEIIFGFGNVLSRKLMRKHGSPMHFREVAKAIEDTFGKKTHVATCHNELIKDKRFVLVGRGIYALQEWGYKTGVVRDVIRDIIKKDGPMSKEDIIERVMKERYLKKNTILVNLQNPKYFKKNKQGLYAIA
jgi:drug/metabolite transporter (DMT)-like permease